MTAHMKNRYGIIEARASSMAEDSLLENSQQGPESVELADKSSGTPCLDSGVQKCIEHASVKRTEALNQLIPELKPYGDLPLSILEEPPSQIPAIPTRASRSLKRVGVVTVGEVCSMSYGEIDGLPTMGSVSTFRLLTSLFRLCREFMPTELEEFLLKEVDVDPSTEPVISRRDQMMCDLRGKGLSLDEIGLQFDLTRERVRQIIEEAGGPSASDVREMKARDDALRIQQIQRIISKEVLSNPGLTIPEIGERCSLSDSDVKKYLPANLKKLTISAHSVEYESSNSQQKWTDAEILKSLKLAQTYVFPVTTSAYAGLVRVGEVQGPSVPLIHNRFGGWAAACQKAGVEHGTTYREYNRIWTDDDLLRFVGLYLIEPHADGTFRGYEQWRLNDCEDAPSGALLRIRIGSWTFIKELVFAGTWQQLKAEFSGPEMEGE